jgi:curli biogenesis system outer membrane secretion channel CsgG
MKLKTILVSGLIVLSQIAAMSQDGKSLKRKVAIGRFSNETQYAKSVFYDKNNDPMGKQASDILSTKLAATEKFIFVERQDYDKIVQEINNSGTVSNQIGADYLIIGSITEFGRKTIGNQKVFSSSKKQVVEAGVSIRLVDVSTGMIIYSGEAKGEAEVEDKKVLGLGTTADYDATLSDKAITAAISQLVENVVTKCMNNTWKAYILSVEDGSYIISGGASQGISAGDTFSIIERGRSVKNPQTGMTIELPGKTVGKISIIQTLGSTIQDEISIATLTEGTIAAENLSNYYVTDTK